MTTAEETDIFGTLVQCLFRSFDSSSRIVRTVRRFLCGVGFFTALGAAALVLPDNARAADDDEEDLSSCPIGAPPGTVHNRDNLRPCVGDTAPELRFTDFDGKPRLLSKLRGKPVLLDFWATWCGPCRAEFPNLREVHETFGEKVTVLSVNLDDALRTAKDFVAKRQTEMPWSQGHVPMKWYKEAYVNYNLRRLPASFLIDANGKIVARQLRGKETKKTVGLFLQNKLKPADESRATIGGIVVDDAGNPIEGASVEFYISRENNPEKGLLYAFASADIKTNKDGRWSYTVFPGAHYGWLQIYHPNYAYEIWRRDSGKFEEKMKGDDDKIEDEGDKITRKEQRDKYEASVFIPNQNFKETADFESLYKREHKHILPRGLAITGVVKNEAGKPIANAEVFMGSSHYGNSVPLQKTGTDGKFHFTRDKGQRVWLKAAAKGFAPDLKKFTMPDKAANVEFILKPAKTIKGVVFDDDGKPLAGAVVVLGNWRGGKLFDTLRDGKTTANYKGQFTFKNMPEDEINVRIYKRGINFYDETFPIRYDKENKIVATRSMTSFRVTALDAKTGEPIRGAIHASVSPENTSSNSFPIHTENPFTLTVNEKPPEGVSKMAIYVRVKGYKPELATGLPLDNKRQDIVVKLERNPHARNKGEPHKPVELQIVTADGTPAVGAKVRTQHDVWLPEKEESKYPKVFTTDKDEKVKLPPVYGLHEVHVINNGNDPDEDDSPFFEPTRGYSFSVTHRGGYKEGDDVWEACEKPVVLEKWAGIKGKVLVGGKPAAGVKVSFKETQAGNILSTGNFWDHFYPKKELVTDKDGAFEFTELERGWKSVSVEINGAASKRLVLNKNGETAEIAIGGQGRPVAAKIIAPDFSGETVKPHDELIAKYFQGKREITPLDSGLYLTPVLGNLRDGVPEKNDSEFYELEWEEKEAKLTARLLQADSKERELFEKKQRGAVGKDGTVRFENVIPGKYRLVVYETGMEYGQIEAASAPFEIKLDAGKTFDETAQDLGVIKLERKKIRTGVTLPNFSFQDFQGKTRNTSEFNGKPWMLFLWGTEIFGREGAPSTSGIKLETLSLSRGGKTAEFTWLEKTVRPPWEKSLNWLTDEQEKTLSALGFGEETPQVFLVDKDGKILKSGFLPVAIWIEEEEEKQKKK
jgi:thiol-disulfide isomerase/thioredoxin